MNIALISMPFARLDFPSLALTQLKFMLKEHYSKNCNVELLYLNHAFSNYIEYDIYKILTGNSVYIQKGQTEEQSHVKVIQKGLKKKRTYIGAGEWLFRKEAFPGKNGMDEYLEVFLKHDADIKLKLQQLRERLPDILDDIINKYQLYRFHVLCFTSMFQQQNANFALINRIKKINPHVKVIIGGSNLDEAAEVFQKECKQVDYYSKGLGYSGIIQALYEIETGKKSKDSKIISAAEYEINQVIPLDYSDFFYATKDNCHAAELFPIVFFETSRGCWWGEKNKCTFCDYNRNYDKFRAMEPKKAIKYIQDILNQNQNYSSYFWAVDSVMPIGYIETVFEHIKVPEDAIIFYEIRANLNKKQLKKLHDCHITMVQSGIEALDTPTLKLLNKGTTAAQNIMLLRDCCEIGILVLWNLLCGIPGENTIRFYDLLQLLPKIFHLYPPTGIWPISYDKNSEYVKRQEDYNLHLLPQTATLSYQYPFSEEQLQRMVYFYENEDNNKIFTLEKMKLVEKINTCIIQWQKKWLAADLPQLYFLNLGKKKYKIIDTRDGYREYAISSEEREVLLYLQQPKSKIDIYHTFSEQVDSFLKMCIKNGIVWSEKKDQYLSLVLNKKTQKSKYKWVWE